MHEFRCTVKCPTQSKSSKLNGFTSTPAETLADALRRPGNWNTEVQVKGRVVTFVYTNHSDDLTDTEALYELADQVGYYASDTLGPATRKAVLTYQGEHLAGSITCRGAF